MKVKTYSKLFVGSIHLTISIPYLGKLSKNKAYNSGSLLDELAPMPLLQMTDTFQGLRPSKIRRVRGATSHRKVMEP
jgi:hypothetical protein